ncbi:MAG: hypothetical protein L0H41_03310 [Microlunatus sp.]|nr:hypothetical protein [Microlunatus sp.]
MAFVLVLHQVLAEGLGGLAVLAALLTEMSIQPGSWCRCRSPADGPPGSSGSANNVGISFNVLCYAGVLGVTIVTDPEIVTEPARLADTLAGVSANLLQS